MNENKDCQISGGERLKDENCKRIIDYSTQKFFKEGFQNITMDDLATDLQISKKTIYKYFASKKCLIETISDGFTNNAAKEIGNVINSHQNAVVKIIGMMKFFSKMTGLISEQLISDLQRKLPWLWKRIDEFRAKMMYKNLTLIVDQGKKEGLIRDYPTEIIITLVISSIRSIINPNFLINNNFSMQTAFITCFDILFGGILTDEGKKIFYNYLKEEQ